MLKKTFSILILLILTAIIFSGLQPETLNAAPLGLDHRTTETPYAGFEADLETVRTALKLPGMSAAVVQDGGLVWASGFGYADLEKGIQAAPETPYSLASVTKPVAAVLIMQLVEEGLIDLDAPISTYGVNLLGGAVTVRHLLTHTSEGTPGMVHHYNGNRYGMLGGVIEGATGRTFAALLSERILLPLEMESTALNPISSWGGSGSSVVKDLQLALGLGRAFNQFPEVYAQLARPYQLDEHYHIIPGMYQIYHNPAAGLISSVADLAEFDIALDQGLLLGEAAKAEMFSSAYATHEDRADLMYGLGWYVQEFEDLQLRWHTGRWPPSTSALYLKIPEEDLTFIVLANTANLTTPFNGIGHGDVSKSLLTLTLFRHFIYPEHHGTELPQIDWWGTEAALVQQLSEINHPAARRYLERELWAYRQAFASVGDTHRAIALQRVSLQTFRDSEMRRDDLFTNTAGRPEVKPPSLSASALVNLSWGFMAWGVILSTSLVWMVILIWRQGLPGWGPRIAWLLSAFFIGPFALLAYTLTRSRVDPESRSRWQMALSAAALIISAYAVGWALAMTMLKNLGHDPHPLTILGFTYLIPLVVTFLFYRLPDLASGGKGTLRRGLAPALIAGLISNNISFAVMFPMTMLFDNRILTTIPGSFSFFSWVMLSLISVLNLGAQFLVHYLGDLRFRVSESPDTGSSALIKNHWLMTAASLIILVISLAITIIWLV